MSLRGEINSDLKKAMKSGDKETRNVLRLLSSDIKNEEINQKKGLQEDAILDILKRNIKRRKDSVRQYREGKRDDLAEKESGELVILEKYMPKQMSDNEIKVIVKKVISEFNEVTPSNFGKIIGAVMKESKESLDGNTVSRIVKKELK